MFAKATTRIAGIGALVAFLVLALFASIARTVTHRLLWSDLDDELETLSVAIASDLETKNANERMTHETLRSGVEANTLAYRLEHHSAVLFDPHGVIAAAGDLARHARIEDLLPFAKHDERELTAREPFTGRRRLCRFRVSHLHQRAMGSTLLVFRSIEAQQRTLRTMDAALALLVLGGAAASAVILWLAVGRALDPVERVTDFAGQITVKDLSQRVVVKAAGEEFHRLAEVINSLLARLEASFQAQQRLVSDAAHELKTPTAVLSAEAQELSRGHLTRAEQIESLEIIMRAAAGLAREVDDLLELARGDAESLRRQERFDLDQAVDEAIASVLAAAQERSIAIVRNAHARCDCVGDRVGIVRALGNLLANAIRYSPRESEVSVALTCANGASTIDVADRGPGVPQSERRRIFERFVRLAAARRDHPEGSGLGLAIVDQIVRAHGGSVEVLDRAGGGALFRVRLPHPAAGATSATSPSASA
jgi:signal transduction histidine kinase